MFVEVELELRQTPVGVNCEISATQSGEDYLSAAPGVIQGQMKLVQPERGHHLFDHVVAFAQVDEHFQIFDVFADQFQNIENV